MATKVEPKKEEVKTENKSEEKNTKDTKDAKDKISEYKPMKKGDYSVHILIEEVKNLISKNEDIPYPIIKISVNNTTKRTKEVNTKVDTYFYGEHFYYDCLDMNNATLDSAKITIEVYDKEYSDRCDYLGIYEFDFNFVYSSPEHALKNYWVALANPESDDFSKIRGYLRFSISILHMEDPRVELMCSTGSGKDGMIALPPQIKPIYYQVDIQIFKAKGVPDMDSIFLNKNKKECNAFIKATYMGVTVKSSVVDMKDNIIVWNEQLSLPVSFPIVSQKICCSIWDKDTLSDDIIGSFEISVGDIINGKYDNFSYVHFYGAPLGVTGEFTDKMNENAEIGSLWKGKLLIRCESKKKEYPKACMTTIPSNSPVLVEQGKIREKTLWNFEIFIENGQFFPFADETYMLKIIIEEQETELPFKKAKNGMVVWGMTRNIAIYALSEKIEDLGDILIYLVKGDEDTGKNRICFQRLMGKYFVDNNEFVIMKFYPDPSIGKVSKVSQSGILKLKVKLTCQGKDISQIQTNTVDKLKSGLNEVKTTITNVIPPKKEDSDDDDLDNIVAKKKKQSVLNNINQQKDKESDKKGQIAVPGQGKYNTVVINIHQTRNIVPGDDDGISDLYVKVRFADKIMQSSVKYKTINGIFNESLVFSGLEFDVKDEKTWPVAFLEVWDKDTFSADDDLGFTYIWITDCSYKVNSLETITPTWINLYLPLSNKKQGKVLVSFYVIDETRTDLVQQLSSIDISPPTQLYSFEINVLGLRGLQPKGIIPVKKPFILFDLNSISVVNEKNNTSSKKDKSQKGDKEEKKALTDKEDKSSSKDTIKTEPKESGPDPTINTIISFENFLPIEKIYIPNMLCFVYDYILAGLGNSILGAFEIDLNKMIESTVSEMNADKKLSEKNFANNKLGNALVKNTIVKIEDERKRKEEEERLAEIRRRQEQEERQAKQKQDIEDQSKKALIEEGGLEEKKEPFLSPEQINVQLNADKSINNLEEEVVDTSKKKTNLLEEVKEGNDQSSPNKKNIFSKLKGQNEGKDKLPKLKKEVLSIFSNLIPRNEDENGDVIVILPKFTTYSLPTPKADDTKDKDDKNKNKKKDAKEIEKEQKKAEIAEKRKAIYVIEDDAKVPDPNKYVELGYLKVSTLKEGQTLEEAAKEKTDPFKKHYRRIYHLPLEDPKTGLGLNCPFIKIPIRVGSYEDKVDKNQIFKALSNNKNKILKEFKKRNDNENLTISSVGQDVDLKEAGYFKGLVRVCEKRSLLEFKDFIKKIDSKSGGNFNHLNKYDELSKKLLVSKEVMVRLYLIDLMNLAEKDTFSKSDPYVKIILGNQVIDESKSHLDDLTDVSLRKCYE